MTAETEWDKGALNHYALWATYYTLNYFGGLLCLLVMIAIYRLDSTWRNAGDVLLGGLMLGCFTMSIPCATQCMLNAIDGKDYFSWGPVACDLEAFFHVSSIMVQFLSIAMIGMRCYMAIVYRVPMTPAQALWLVAAVCALGWLGTFITGRFSDIYLMPAGAYCFYRMSSPTIAYWFSPVMVVALLLVIYWYYRIFSLTKSVSIAATSRSVVATSTPIQTTARLAPTSPSAGARWSPISSSARKPTPDPTPHILFPAAPAASLDVASARPSHERQSSIPRLSSAPPIPAVANMTAAVPTAILSDKVARRTIWFVLTFFVGWFPAVITCIYELAYGPVLQELDVTLAVMGSLHSVLVPLVYGFWNPRLKPSLWATICCCRPVPSGTSPMHSSSLDNGGSMVRGSTTKPVGQSVPLPAVEPSVDARAGEGKYTTDVDVDDSVEITNVQRLVDSAPDEQQPLHELPGQIHST